MNRRFVVIGLLLAAGICFISWGFLQYKYVSFDKELFHVVSSFVQLPSGSSGSPQPSSQIKEQLAALQLEKIKNDFNFNFITGFLATAILGIGIFLFLQVNAHQRELQGNIDDLRVQLENETRRFESVEGRFRILDRDVSEMPGDLIYALVRLHVLSSLWENEKGYNRYWHEMNYPAAELRGIIAMRSLQIISAVRGVSVYRFFLGL